MHECWTTYWSVTNLPAATPPKEIDLSTANSEDSWGWDLIGPASIHVGVLTGLLLCRSYANKLSYVQETGAQRSIVCLLFLNAP